MSRWRIELAAILVAVGVVVPVSAWAQPAPPTVVEISLPVVELSYETASLDGSVESLESRRETRLTLAADVLFRFNKASLTPKARSRLAEVVSRVRAAKPKRATVEGYTDSKGSDAYNDRLSLRRAQAVARALEQRLGGDAPSLRTVGRGEEDPVAENEVDGEDNPRGRAKNRRVTVSFGRSAP
jgi:outer membrane protein OmpA-like peptidoglycan-associated protein